jgi:hypothetical protein
MNGTPIIAIEERRKRTRRLDNVRTARALLREIGAENRPRAREVTRGSAWINGRRVGGGNPRHDHLYETYD